MIAEAQARVKAGLPDLPKGYCIEWVGEFENQVRATARLGQVVPISLLGIFIILFIMFSNAKSSTPFFTVKKQTRQTQMQVNLLYCRGIAVPGIIYAILFGL